MSELGTLFSVLARAAASIGTIGLRAVMDVVENTLLVLTIMQYPIVNQYVIYIAATCTQVKLYCIIVWLGSILGGFIVRKKTKG